MIAVTKTREIPLVELRPYPGNPRRGNVPAIVESLRAHGQYRALVVNTRTGHVLAGNHTLQGLREIGATAALCHEIDVPASAEAAIVLADNRTNDLAGYDDAELAALLESLHNFDGTGYDGDDLKALLASMEDAPPPDTAPALGAVEYRILIECDDEQHQTRLLTQFESDGLRTIAIAQ